MSELPADIKTIFADTLEKQTGAERNAYLSMACRGDAALQRRVEALLRAYAEAHDVPDTPLVSFDVPSPETLLTEGPGTVIGRYKLLEKIGEGGMAVVYMAEQTEPIRRKVALKIIKLGMDTRQVIARFEAERQALALMDHPSIAKVLDAGATETGRPYFVMELVSGVSITEYCDKNNLSTRDRLALFLQVCHAVQHAHQKGIIHRDIKPSNVMVTHRDGQPVPKVIDFGIAKATNQKLTEKTLFTRYAHIIGTPAYMSPEQAELSDLDIDTRSDIYSLGVLLYELLTGTTPFTEEELRKAGYVEMQRVIREQEPAKPSTKLSALGETLTDIAKCRNSTPDLLRKALRGDLDWIVMKALEKDRTRRYDSGSALLADIRRYLDHEPVLAGPPTARYRAQKFLQRHRTLVTLVVFVAVIVVAGLGVSLSLYLQAEYARAGEVAARAQAQAVTDFLTKDLLASVYPEKARNREVTVRYLLESAARDLDQKFATSPLAEAQIRETLGRTYQKMGDNEAAQPHLERVLEIRRKQLGEEHPATLASLNQLGLLFSNWGRYQEAEPLLVRALDLRRRVLGEEHHDTLESMADLGWQYMAEARFPEGMTLAARALEIGGHVLPEEDPIMLRSMNALAVGYVTVMRYAEAVSLAGKGYEISRRVLGEEHETTLSLANVLSWAYEGLGGLEAATELAARTLEIGRRLVGEEHSITIWAMSNLGAACLKQGRLAEAAPLLTRSFELATQQGGQEHAGTLLLGLRLAGLYRAQERWAEHETLLIKLIEVSRRTHGESHPQTGYIKYWLWMRLDELGALGRGQYSSGDYEKAAQTFTRSAEMHVALYGQPSAAGLAYLAMSWHQLGRDQEAQTQLRLLRAMYEDGRHAYEAEHLHRAELLLAPEGSQVRQVWEWIEAADLDQAAALVEVVRGSNGAGDFLRTETWQSLIRALAQAYCRRAAVAEVDRDYAKAQSSCEAAMRIRARYALPRQKLAWLRATCPAREIRDGVQAIGWATQACELTHWKNAECLEALAAACAEAGDCPTAVRWQEKAIELLPARAHEGRKTVCAERLHLYKSGRPFHARDTVSLVGRWDFEAAPGGKVVDASGHGLEGTLVGDATIAVDEQRGNVLCLKGQGYVDCGAHSPFDFTGPITLAAWIRTSAARPGYQAIIAKGGGWTLQRFRDQRTIYFGCPGLDLPDDDWTTLHGRAEVVDGQWHHVAGVYDGVRMCLYIDGKLDASAGVGGVTNVSDKPVWIGANLDKTDSEWNGWIDDMRVYHGALDAAEIRTLYAGHEPWMEEK